MRFFPALFLLAFLFFGCKTTAEPAAPDETVPEESPQPQIVDGISATVKYIDLEGGFYGIQSDAGDSYLPINLDESYKEDGLRIVFKMKSRPDVMTTKMWGKTIEITEIAKL